MTPTVAQQSCASAERRMGSVADDGFHDRVDLDGAALGAQWHRVGNVGIWASRDFLSASRIRSA